MKKLIILLCVLSLVLCGCSRSEEKTDDTAEQLAVIAQQLDSIASALGADENSEFSENNVYFEDDGFADESNAQTPLPPQSQNAGNSSSSSSYVSSSASTSKSNSVPTSVDEIVKYFSASANAVKKDKPGFTITETPSVGEVKSHGGSSSVLNALKNAAMKLVEPSEKSAKKGENHNVFPVEGQSWACKLDPSFVKKAECKKVGNYYNISIYLKDETLPALPNNPEECNTGKVVNILTQEQIGDILGSIPFLTINGFAPTYSGCYVTCKINAKTQKMVSATYYMNNIVTIKANSSIEVSVDFAIKQEIKINY